MSIKILEDARPHPARAMAIRSIQCVEGKDREGWLSLWADDAVIQDPVGVSPLDPEGLGHRGTEAITAFYDKVIAPVDLRFQIRQSFACGDECANVGTITTKLGGMTGVWVISYRGDGDHFGSGRIGHSSAAHRLPCPM